MRNVRLLFAIAVVMLFTATLTYGQSYRKLPIYRYFNAALPDTVNILDTTSITCGGWSIQSVTGNDSWYIQHYYGVHSARCTGYSATNQVPEEQWFISPGFSTINYSNVMLSFVSEDKFAGNALQVLVSTNYNGTGLPSTATWTDITSDFTFDYPNPTNPRVWTKSGNGNLSAYSGNNVYIGFKYTCDAINSVDWALDSISITGSPMGINELNQISDKITIFPNPVSANNNKITLTSDKEPINKIQIYNMVGELIASYSNVNNKIYSVNLTNLQEGLYFTRVLLKNGIIISEKITKIN